jgi:hypothetical protein
MSDRLSDDELNALGGDCTPFVQLCPCLRSQADAVGLNAGERHAWIELILAADYRTGIVGSLTWQGAAELLGCSIPTAKERLSKLEERGLIRCRFPRGHQGYVAVVSYLDVVRVKHPGRTEAIASALANAVAVADQAAARSQAATQARNGADPAGHSTGNDEGFRSDEGILRSEDPASLAKEGSERAGEPGPAAPFEPVQPSFASTAAVGGQSRGAPSPTRTEATRSDRIRAYDASVLGVHP